MTRQVENGLKLLRASGNTLVALGTAISGHEAAALFLQLSRILLNHAAPSNDREVREQRRGNGAQDLMSRSC
jgi:hypothetical protein